MTEFEYIRSYYGVPAEEGRRVEYTSGGKTAQGVITGSRNQYIVIHFDGEKKPRGCFHPVDGITYLGMGKVPKMTRSQIRYQRFLNEGDCFDSFKDFLGYLSDERSAHKLGFATVNEYYRWLKGGMVA